MKVYDLVKKILEESESTRNNDRLLIWEVMRKTWKTNVTGDTISKEDFMEAPSFESITRARRKVQEIHPHLQANKKVKSWRDRRAKGNPNVVFCDDLSIFD